MTYSILGWDASNGDLGVAVQSKFPGVGSLVPYGEAEVGVVATQAFGNPRHGSAGSDAPEVRRHATDRRSTSCSTATPTGTSGSSRWSTGAAASLPTPEPTCTRGTDGRAAATGRDCVALGNGLAGSDVVDQMVTTFEGSRAPLAERLMAALESGQQAGGDIRGQQSAALLVLRRDGGYGSLDDRHVVISMYDHAQPIDELVAVLRPAPALLLPQRAVEAGAHRTRAGARAEGPHGGPRLLPGSRRTAPGTRPPGGGGSCSWAARTTTTGSTTADARSRGSRRPPSPVRPDARGDHRGRLRSSRRAAGSSCAG